MKKNEVILITIFLLQSFLCFSSTVTLENGRILEGKIISASTESIIIDLNGSRLEYNLSEIRSIDGKKIIYRSSTGDYAKHIYDRREYSLALSKAQQLLRERKYQEASDSYKIALTFKPDSVLAYNGLAIASMSMGNLQEAIDNCQKGIALNPDFPNIYGVRGQAYLFLQDFDKAEADFKKAKELITQHKNYSDNIQLNNLKDHIEALLNELRRRKKLIEYKRLPIDQRVEMKADDRFLEHFNRGKDYLLTGKYLLAIDEFEKAAAIKDGDYETFNYLADAYEGLSRYDEAKNAYKRSIELNPKYALANYNLGILYANRFRDKEAAVQYFVEAVSIDPLYAEAYHNLGILYRKLGDFDLAIENLKKAMSLFRIKGELHHVERLEQDLDQVYLESGKRHLIRSPSGARSLWSDRNFPYLIFAFLVIIYGSIFLWIRNRKGKGIFVLAFLGGWAIFLGSISIISGFINIFQIEEQALLGIVNAVFLFFGACFLGLGCAILHSQHWVRKSFLIFLLVMGTLATAIAILAKIEPRIILMISGFSLFHFMVYYFGLAKKYLEPFDKIN